jgi:hypothetical protein
MFRTDGTQITDTESTQIVIHLIINILCNICVGNLCAICVKQYVPRFTLVQRALIKVCFLAHHAAYT